MKTIVFLFYNFEIGGAQNALVNICNSVSAQNINCKIICISKKGLLFKNLNKNIEVIFLNKRKIIFSILPVISLIKKIRPFSVISTLYGTGKLLVILKFLFGRKIKTCYREATNPLKDFSRVYFWNSLIYKKNDFILCNSICIINLINNNFEISKKKLYLFRNSISDVINSNSLIHSKIKRFLFVGRISRVKRIDLQLKALALLDDLNFVFDIYGYVVDYDYYRELLILIKKLDLKDKVSFIFDVTEKSKIYSESDFLLLTSKYEGFPTVLLESISYNVYPISFNIECGPSEIIVNDLVGKLIDEPESNKEFFLCETINKCWDFKVDCNEAKKVLSNFNINKNTSNFLNLLYEKSN